MWTGGCVFSKRRAGCVLTHRMNLDKRGARGPWTREAFFEFFTWSLKKIPEIDTRASI